jgi:hypothetical protein
MIYHYMPEAYSIAPEGADRSAAGGLDGQSPFEESGSSINVKISFKHG